MSGADAFCCALVLPSHPALNATTTAAVVIAVRMDSIWPPENERTYHVHRIDLPDCTRVRRLRLAVSDLIRDSRKYVYLADEVGWEAGIRTPITASRAPCPTVERPPKGVAALRLRAALRRESRIVQRRSGLAQTRRPPGIASAARMNELANLLVVAR